MFFYALFKLLKAAYSLSIRTFALFTQAVQLKKQFTYRLLGFLLLFTAMYTAVAGTAASNNKERAHVEKQAKTQGIEFSEQGNESNVNLSDCLPDLSLCNTQVPQAGGAQASKRIQTDKDLLLLHADSYTKAVKASSGDDKKFADDLTRIYLYLFPHHFFW